MYHEEFSFGVIGVFRKKSLYWLPVRKLFGVLTL
jgi:hypothetical protein